MALFGSSTSLDERLEKEKNRLQDLKEKEKRRQERNQKKKKARELKKERLKRSVEQSRTGRAASALFSAGKKAVEAADNLESGAGDSRDRGSGLGEMDILGDFGKANDDEPDDFRFI